MFLLRLFIRDELRWNQFCKECSIHFKWKGRKYLIRPGKLGWYLILMVPAVIAFLVGYFFVPDWLEAWMTTV